MSDYSEIKAPAFVLEEDQLKANLGVIREVQQAAGVNIILALKAFALWRVFPLVNEYLSGATASSLNEARLIFEEMGERAHTYSPAYMPDEMEELLGYSSHLTFNSLRQYARYRDQVAAFRPGVSMGLRVNPEYSEVETDLYNPASPTGRLGETAPNIEEWPAGLEGLHAHTLCECSARESALLIEAIEEKFGRFLPQLKWVNLGGGHLMTRAGYDRAGLIATLQAFRERHPHLEVWLEPGSAIAWETGVLVSHVLDVIENHGAKTAILDVSFTAHMPDTLEMPYRPRIRNASSDPRNYPHRYRLGGVSCLAGDYLEAYSFPEPLKPGDQLIFEDMIHYTLVKTTMFNGVRHPDIIIRRSDGRLDRVRQFTYEDYRNRMG